jgi:WD40 repeat protein
MDWDAEKIDIFYSDSGDPNNMDFSFVTNLSVPKPANAIRQPPMGPIVLLLEFSADGSKFATATSDGVLSVWDVRSQIPLMVLTVEKQRFENTPITFLKFSKGISGREVLVFMEVSQLCTLVFVHLKYSVTLRTHFFIKLFMSSMRHHLQRGKFLSYLSTTVIAGAKKKQRHYFWIRGEKVCMFYWTEYSMNGKWERMTVQIGGLGSKY